MEKSLSLQSGLEAVITNENDGEKSSLKSKSFCQKIRVVFTNITVEPISLCYFLPYAISNLTTQNLNLEKACRVNLGFEDSVCSALAARNSSGYNTTEEVAVQKLVASMNAWKNIIQSFVPGIMLLVLGSWSDRHKKRKPCIALPLCGDLTTSICLLLCTYFFYQLPMEWNAIAEAVPSALAGGWATMAMAIFSYISNVSTLESRTLRIGAANLFLSVSYATGIALSGILFRKLNFYGVYCTTLTLYVIGLTYLIFIVKEVPRYDLEESKEKQKKSFLLDFFDLKHMKDTIKVAFKEGKRNRKKRICIIMILVMVIIGPIHGEMNVMYLFVRYRFGWDEVDYSMFATFASVLHLLGTAFNLAFCTKFLKVDDALLGTVSVISKILSCFVFAFAPNPIVFYLGSVVEMFSGTSFIAMRSIMSKLVPPDEVGKLNSLFGLCESLMPFIYGPMYSLTYKRTIDWLPGSFFILGGILTLPAVFIFLWLYLEHKRDEKEVQKSIEQEEALLKGKKADTQDFTQ